MNDTLKSIWKGTEAVVVKSTVLSQHLPAGTEENTKTSVMIAVSGPRFEPGTS
jgi:hypothetical protein